MTPSKSQRPPFFRLLLEGCKLSWELAPRCLCVLLPFHVVTTSLSLLWLWFLMGEVQLNMQEGPDGTESSVSFLGSFVGTLVSALAWLGTASVAWITICRMEGEAPSPRDAIRRLGQTWRIVLASGLLIALLSFLLNLKSLYDGQSFLAGIDAKNLNMVYTGLMCAAIALSLFFTLRMSFISAIPMVEGLGFIESIKRSNSLITGNTGYMFLLWCVFILFAVPGVFIGTFLNSNFIEYTLAQVEADLANKTSQVVLELGMPWTPLGIAGYMLNMIFLLYSTVTTAALYQHLRKLKSA